ncbi:MAG TPA: RluA family pseudouridine synthase [Hyphomicrobiales bacterium]|nr:RluA family pseudouridine synthase [Kaistiaceae bacterium]HQF31751.1 RluA family pseudouridine synthase [Hyphomicrobiales bacterium]
MDDDPEAEGGERVALAVDGDGAGMRLDAFLAARLPAFSRSRLKQLIVDGRVAVGGRTIVEAKYRVNEAEEVMIEVPEAEPAEPVAEDIALAILHEDADLVVIDKPAGMVVHPAPGNATGTLVNALLGHCGAELSGIGGVKRPGIVHRLDKETSGVMVVAKTDAAHRGLAKQFADHGRSGPLERAYLALVWGVPARRTGTIATLIGRSPANRQKMAVVRRGGREAITHYTVLETFGPREAPIAALVECRLETGRTHQIRVHMAHLGHPLVGDPDYGSGFRTKVAKLPEAARGAVEAFGRQALHAALLGFEHPVSGEEMVFESALPEDLAGLLDVFRAL